MTEPRRAGRFRLLLTALLPADWLNAAGQLYRRITLAASGTVVELNRDVELGMENVSELAVDWVEGQANSKMAEALKAFAEQEKVKIETELQKRALSADLRRREADASKAEIEAERERTALPVDLRKRAADTQKAGAEALMAQLRLQEEIVVFVDKQRASGVLVVSLEPNRYVIQEGTAGLRLGPLSGATARHACRSVAAGGNP
jgi:hypothetical protein